MQSGIKSPIWKTDLIVNLYIIKYIVKEKKMLKYITDDLIFSDENLDEENYSEKKSDGV